MKIGFLGGGKMASALAKGFIEAGLARAANVIAGDPIEAARAGFKGIGANSTAFNPDVAQFARVIFLAVKPDQASEVLREVSPHFTDDHLLISIVAGVPLAKLESALRTGARIIRVMPNTPALVGASATAYALGRGARAEDGELAQRFFSTIGWAVQLKESHLDAVTGLSGSGPAYVFMVIEALSDGGVAAGLPREVATKLAAQTVFGSAKMVLETGLHPAALKDMVTSPGGTTIEGVHELEKAKVRGAFVSAVRAAAEKSKKLGQRVTRQ